MLKRLSVNFLGGSSEPAPEEIRQSVMVDYGDVFDAEKETDYIGREKKDVAVVQNYRRQSGGPAETSQSAKAVVSDGNGDQSQNEIDNDRVTKEPTLPENFLIPKPRKGLMDKLASATVVKNWRTRYFVLEKGTMSYFEPVHWYFKGQYDLVGLTIVEDPSDPPEFIRMRSPNRGEDIYLKCKDEKSKTRWIHAISEHIDYANMTGVHSTDRYNLSSKLEDDEADIAAKERQYTVTVPEPCSGWLEKKGQFMPTIKRRFFVLEAGMISYYKDDVTALLADEDEESIASISRSRSASTTRRLPTPLGKFCIQDYKVYSQMESGRIEIILTPGDRSKSIRQMSIYCDDFMERDKWMKALKAHSGYDTL